MHRSYIQLWGRCFSPLLSRSAKFPTATLITTQGSRFYVGPEGATLGRKQTNTIAFSHESNGTVMGIDASISGDHARIVYDEEGDYLHIMDGTPNKVRLRAIYALWYPSSRARCPAYDTRNMFLHDTALHVESTPLVVDE